MGYNTFSTSVLPKLVGASESAGALMTPTESPKTSGGIMIQQIWAAAQESM